MNLAAMRAADLAWEATCDVAAAAARPLQALLLAPSLLFLATLAVMLFRPTTGVQIYAVDRILFVLLVFVVLLRASLLRESFPVVPSITWPLLGLVLVAFPAVLANPYEAQSWSLFATKWLIPFALFHVSGLVFAEARDRRRLEVFLLLALGYLMFIAIAFLTGLKSLIFPAYILDEGLGIHADRARGPFLQAVANGVALNLLGLVALDAFRRDRLRGMLAGVLLIALPLAILATLTRAVWLSFAGSLVLAFVLCPGPRMRRACLGLIAAGVALPLALVISGDGVALQDRIGELETVEYRAAAYDAGWEMFLEKPLLGWGAHRAPYELANCISGYRQDEVVVHNTYLEILVHHGVLGFALYIWLVIGLFRVGRKQRLLANGNFPDGEFRSLWPVLLGVYLINGFFVVMNYQFVNGLVFSLAGILAWQNRLEMDGNAN